jgi:hypothetical protein
MLISSLCFGQLPPSLEAEFLQKFGPCKLDNNFSETTRSETRKNAKYQRHAYRCESDVALDFIDEFEGQKVERRTSSFFAGVTNQEAIKVAQALVAARTTKCEGPTDRRKCRGFHTRLTRKLKNGLFSLALTEITNSNY